MPANYVKIVNVKEDSERFLENLSERLKEYNWKIDSLTDKSLTLTTGTSFLSWGERIIIEKLSHSMLSITSECKLVTQIVDWGKNKRNVERILTLLP
jgi:hypothetical protein